ncbi:unnamed protein product [Jaminaea pallidilutea]
MQTHDAIEDTSSSSLQVTSESKVGKRLAQVVTYSSTTSAAVRYGTVRFEGQVHGTKGTWLGVDWDQPDAGKHDGEYKGVRYFKAHAALSASFIRPTGLSDGSIVIGGLPLLQGLQGRYAAADSSEQQGEQKSPSESHYTRKNLAEIQIEAPNMNKVESRVRQFAKLKVVTLTGPMELTEPDIRHLESQGRIGPTKEELKEALQQLVGRLDAGRESEMGHILTNVQHLDLSRTLFASWADIAFLSRCLPRLRSIHLHHNRLNGAADIQHGMERIEELGLDCTNTEWSVVMQLAPQLPNLKILTVARNGIRSLADSTGSLASLATLEELNLEANELDSWPDIHAAVCVLPSLRRLHLSSNRLHNLEHIPDSATKLQVEHVSLTGNPMLDLTECQDMGAVRVKLDALWSSLYHLDASIAGGLQSLSIHLASMASRNAHIAAHIERESSELRLNVIARLPNLTKLNGTVVSPVQRKDAELWWITKMRQRWRDEGETSESLARLQGNEWRWKPLQDAYEGSSYSSQEKVTAGPSRVSDDSQATLKSRLLSVKVCLARIPPSSSSGQRTTSETINSSTSPQSQIRLLPTMNLKVIKPKLQRTAKSLLQGSSAMGPDIEYHAILRGDNDSSSSSDSAVAFELDDELRTLQSWGFQEEGDQIWIVSRDQ